MNSLITLHFFVNGRVQGVFYRRFCQLEAQKLGLTGWAKNLADGRVEIKASGQSATLKQYEQKLREGSIASRVITVSGKEVPFEAYQTFDVF